MRGADLSQLVLLAQPILVQILDSFLGRDQGPLMSLGRPSHVRALLLDFLSFQHVLLHERLELVVSLIVVIDDTSNLTIVCLCPPVDDMGDLLTRQSMRLALQAIPERGALRRSRLHGCRDGDGSDAASGLRSLLG